MIDLYLDGLRRTPRARTTKVRPKARRAQASKAASRVSGIR
jgi:hypothetical protein